MSNEDHTVTVEIEKFCSTVKQAVAAYRARPATAIEEITTLRRALDKGLSDEAMERIRENPDLCQSLGDDMLELGIGTDLGWGGGS